MSEYTGYERDLDYSEAVLVALMRIAPGETKTVREIHRCVIGLMVHSRNATPVTTATVDLIERSFRGGIGGFLVGYEVVYGAGTAGMVTGVHHAG